MNPSNLTKINFLTFCIISFSILLLSSCEKTKHTTNCKNVVKVGELHNNILTYYYNVTSLESNKLSDLNYSREAVSIIMKYLEFEEYLINQDTAEIIEIIIESEYWGLPLDIPFLSMDSILYGYIRAAADSLDLTTNLTLKLDSVVAICGENPDDPAPAYSYIENEILNCEFEYPQDDNAASIFCDVYFHSYNYWTAQGRNMKSGNRIMLQKASWTILNDAIGATYGLAFGPFGSIVGGAFFSIAHNEGWFGYP